MKKLFAYTIIFIYVVINSCQKESGASSNDVYVQKVKGYVQKGPYINGTSITLYKLNNNLEQQGTSYSSNILDNKGTFELSSLNFPSKYVLFYANGFYFNEVSGLVSAAPLQLYSLADITNAASINVNVMTHLERRRVEYLVKQGQIFAEAKKTAQKDILNIFGFTIPSIQASEKLDINVTGDENAILLAISLILQGNLSVGDFSELLSTISTDLELDGKLENTMALEKLKSNVFALNLPNIRKNLESRYQSLGLTASIPNFEKYIQQYLSTFPIDITSGLVAFYPFNGNANDESGNGNNGTVNGAILTSDRNGNLDKAYSFNGVNSWIAIADNKNLNPTTSISISLWVNTTVTHSNGGIIGKWNNFNGIKQYGQEQYVFYAGPNYQGIRFYTVTSVGAAVVDEHVSLKYNDGSWHHFVGVWDGTKMSFYRDNILIDSVLQTGNLKTFIQGLEIGRYSGGMDGPVTYFNGIIDDVRIYNRALTAEQITYLSNN